MVAMSIPTSRPTDTLIVVFCLWPEPCVDLVDGNEPKVAYAPEGNYRYQFFRYSKTAHGKIPYLDARGRRVVDLLAYCSEAEFLIVLLAYVVCH
jgi:hypothetical protein